MESVFSKAAEIYGFDYGFDPSMSNGEGDTFSEFNGGDSSFRVTDVRIGISPRFANGSRFLDEPVDDYAFMSVLVAIPHEYQHIEQILVDSRSDGFPSPVLYANQLSQIGNPSFYFQNYSRNPCEIDAQFGGIHGTYRYLVSKAGVVEADRLVLLYQNRRQLELRNAHERDLENVERMKIEGSEEWKSVYVCPLDFIDAGRDYSSVRGIFSSYKRVFLRSVHSTRLYDLDLANGDLAVRRMADLGDVGGICMKKLLAERDGFRQDVMVASLLFDQEYQAKYVLPEIEKRTGLKLLRSDAFRPAGLPERIRSVVPTRNPSYDVESRFGRVLEGKAIQGPEDGLGGNWPR